MAFNVSYKGLTDRNIKYIYSDQKQLFVFPKRGGFRPLKEERTLPPLKRYPRRFYEYYPRYDIGLPRAPAFRGTDPETIERIVQRICKPIQCQKSRRKDLHHQHNDRHDGGYEDDFEDGSDVKKTPQNTETPRSDASFGAQSRRSREGFAALLARLQKPTESSRKKEYDSRKDEDRRNAMRATISPLPRVDSAC